jgi:hypothetical protein
MTVPPTSDPVGIPRAYLGDYEKGRTRAREQLVASGLDLAIAQLRAGMFEAAQDTLQLTRAGMGAPINACQNDFIATERTK